MQWRQICTRPSTTTMLTQWRLKRYTKHILRLAYHVTTITITSKNVERSWNEITEGSEITRGALCVIAVRKVKPTNNKWTKGWANSWAPSQYKDHLSQVWGFPCYRQDGQDGDPYAGKATSFYWDAPRSISNILIYGCSKICRARVVLLMAWCHICTRPSANTKLAQHNTLAIIMWHRSMGSIGNRTWVVISSW